MKQEYKEIPKSHMPSILIDKDVVLLVMNDDDLVTYPWGAADRKCIRVSPEDYKRRVYEEAARLAKDFLEENEEHSMDCPICDSLVDEPDKISLTWDESGECR